jgi:DNA replication protein DnaC
MKQPTDRSIKRDRDVLALPATTIRLLSRNPMDKTWTCASCGVIPPLPLYVISGWYMRRKCPCELRAVEARQIREILQRQQLNQAGQTYTWLGPEWSESETDFASKTFATFRRERQTHAFDRAWAYAQHPQGILAFYGLCGTGKTHLLAAIANHISTAGQLCLFVSAVTLFDAIQDRIQHKEDYHALLKRGMTTPLLLLDDVDKLKPSEFREEVLYQLLNGRNTTGSPLAVSSNCTPDELEHWIGKAGRSRLMQGLIPVKMDGPDFRLELRS